MHELALSESILAILEEQARAEGIDTIHKVVLEVGAMAGVEPESLRFCFDAVTRNSIAQGAELVLIHLPAIALCRECKVSFPLHNLLTPCPHCSALGAQLIEGMELRLREFEGDPAGSATIESGSLSPVKPVWQEGH